MSSSIRLLVTEPVKEDTKRNGLEVIFKTHGGKAN